MSLVDELEQRAQVAGFRVPEPIAIPALPEPPEPTATELLAPALEQIQALATAIQNQRPPEIVLPSPLPPPEPDWLQVADAVQKPIIDMGNRIVEALPKEYPAPPAVPDNGDILQAIQKALDNLAFSMKGLGRLGSGGGTVSLAANQTVGITGNVTVVPGLASSVSSPTDVTVVVTGTAVQLANLSAISDGILVQALQQNTGTGATTLRVGSSSVGASGPGAQLTAGQGIVFPVTNANLLYINGTAGDGVCITAV